MVHSAAIKAGVLCILVVFVISCLATGRRPEDTTETVVTHTTASARVSMLRRGRQEAAPSDSPLQQAGPQASFSPPHKRSSSSTAKSKSPGRQHAGPRQLLGLSVSLTTKDHLLHLS